MLAMIKRYPRAFFLAVVVHVIFALLMGMSLHIHDYTPSSKGKVSVVQAVAVDEKQVAKELKRIKSAEQQKQRKLNRDIQRAQAQRKREERRLAALKAKQQQQKLAEQKHLAQIQKQKQALEQQRQKEQAELEKARQQRAAEEKALQQIDQQRKEDDLKRQMADEQERLAKQNQQRQSTIERYKSMIQAAIRKQWRVPPGARVGMVCTIRVRLLPSGAVVRVEVVKGSGNTQYDNSVKVAVREASPLPVPSVETGLFEEFRDIQFPFQLKSKV